MWHVIVYYYSFVTDMLRITHSFFNLIVMLLLINTTKNEREGVKRFSIYVGVYVMKRIYDRNNCACYFLLTSSALYKAYGNENEILIMTGSF